MKSLFMILILGLSLSLHAGEITMALITSDIDRNTTEFLMEVDGREEIHGIRIRTTTPAGRITEDFSYSTPQVLDGEVVLHERDGFKAVKLRVDRDFSAASGGGVILDYLYSGITGARHYLSLKLVKQEGKFVLQKNTGELVNQFYFSANRHPILGIIGVREIRLSHQ